MLCIASSDGYFKWLNPAFALTLGWTIEELLARPYTEFVHPDDVAATVREVERQIAAGEKVFHFENRYRHQDGSWRVLSWKSVPEGDLMYAVARDVTERNRLEDALQETNAELERRVSARTAALESEVAERRKAEQKIRGLLEAAPDAMIITDQTGRILLASHRVEAMFGYTAEEILGSSINVLLPERHRDLLTAYVQSPKGGNIDAGRELNGLRKDGSEFPVEISFSPDHTAEGLVVIAVVRDITDRKAVEIQLRQAQKMEAIGNLTGGMAHDFNNLLGIIIGNLDLLRERQKVDLESEEFAREALDAALRGADLTQRLLAFARRQPLQPQRIDVNELVTRITKLLSRTLGDNFEITLDLADGVWPIIADPAQLEASLVNIVNNARDAMPRGGILTIATSNRHLDQDYASQQPGLSPGDYSLIEVSDTGIGIPPGVVSRIFEPFFTTKEQGKGTGLGLSMVFGFMKQSGGHINVYSEVGVGTTFRLYLPRAVAGTNAIEAQAVTAPERGGRETVLVVEDNAGLRRVAARQLKELGYRLLEAESGPTALTVLESETVDLLFTDIVMPGGMSGYDLAREALSRRPALKVVLTSGFPEVKLNGNGGPPLSMRLLTKPYRKADLARTLREVLDA
jgi:PAS domain S-box-containing protein